MVPGSEVLIRNVGINPTRDGILRVCRDMGAHIELLNAGSGTGEPTADILVRHGSLHGTDIGGSLIPTLIDELPVIAAMACFAEGETVIRDAGELKVKESTDCGHGPGTDCHGRRRDRDRRWTDYPGRRSSSRSCHRQPQRPPYRYMTFAVTGLCADGITEIKDADCVNISYPGFYSDLKRLAPG